jgi:hypothetical protein
MVLQVSCRIAQGHMLGTRTVLLDKTPALLYVLVRDNLVCRAGRYDMALRLGDIMEELSQHDYYTHDGQDAVPAWVRAHYILDQQMIQQRAGEGGTLQSAVRAYPAVSGPQEFVAVRHMVMLRSWRRLWQHAWLPVERSHPMLPVYARGYRAHSSTRAGSASASTGV